MVFERMPLSEKFKGLLGNIPFCFVICIYGRSGNGKTELSLQLAKEFSKHGKVEWVAYETGHGADMQDAVNRNDFTGLPISWTDPWAKPKPGVTLFSALVAKMRKPHSAKYWFIDSYDATKFTEEEILQIQTEFGTKKGIVWIAHADDTGKKPHKSVAKKIEYYGQCGICVRNYIARCINKNRFGGFDPYVVYEKRARELDPLFFEARDKVEVAEPVKKGKKGKKVVDD